MKSRIFIPALAGTLALFIWTTQSSFIKPGAKGKGTIKWNETTHNFGDIKMGPDAVATFIFTNKTKKPVVVKSAQPGCSCTVSSFTADPVKKGRKGNVVATYKTVGRPGFFKKFIQVTFEDGQTSELAITGNVVQEPKL